MTLADIARVAVRYTFGFGRGYLSSFLSALSMTGLVIAIGLLVTVMSVMNGFDREMRERILALIPHISLYSHYEVADWNEVVDTVEAHPTVNSAQPFGRFDALLMQGGGIETASVLGLSLRPGDLPAQMTDAVPAEQFEAMRADPRGILLGQHLARALGVGSGDTLTLVIPSAEGARGDGTRFASFTYRGSLATGTELDNAAALIHLDAVASAIGQEDAIAGLRVDTRDIFDVGNIAWQLQSELPPGYYTTNWLQTHGNLYAAIQLSRDLVSVLLFSIIAVAAFNVVSSLVLVVFDKRGDIAILRTLGAHPRQIMMLFLLQGALIGVVGVGLGSALGVLGSVVVTDAVAALERSLDIQFLNTDVYPVAFLPSDLIWSDVVWVAVVAFTMCVLAAVYPARRAARLAPAQVLGQE